MTEPTAADQPESPLEPHPITPTIDLHQLPDPNLVEVTMQAHFLGFPLTLYMPWGIASGITAAPSDYYRHLADSVRGTQFPGGDDPQFRQVIDDLAQKKFGRWADLKPSDWVENLFHDGVNLTAAVTLRNAYCWIGGFAEPNQHEYLRVRLTDVTAWAWGVMTPNAN